MDSSQRFMSPPDTDEPQSPQSGRGETPYITQANLINKLISSNMKLSEEKNQLVVERAELLIAQQKMQDENRELQGELGNQRRINQELAFELQRRLEVSLDVMEEAEGISEAVEVIKEDVKDEFDVDWDRQSSPGLFVQQDEDLDAVEERYQEQLPFHAKVVAMFPHYRFTPVTGYSIDGQTSHYGRIEDVAAETAQSLIDSVQAYRDRRERLSIQTTTVPSLHRQNICGYLWMFGQGTSMTWTVEGPTRFTCRLCFNRRRACFYHQGDGQWTVLPLPPQVRDVNATHRDAGFYIYGGPERMAKNFPGVWGASEAQRRKRKRDESVKAEDPEPEI